MNDNFQQAAMVLFPLTIATLASLSGVYAAHHAAVGPEPALAARHGLAPEVHAACREQQRLAAPAPLQYTGAPDRSQSPQWLQQQQAGIERCLRAALSASSQGGPTPQTLQTGRGGKSGPPRPAQ